MFRGKKALAILLGATMLLSTAAGDIKVYAAGTEQVVAASGKGSANEGQIRLTEQGLEIGWDAIENASEYDVYHSASRYGTYTKLATVKGTTYTDTAVGGDKYAHYYKVAKAGSGELSAPISLEISMFGEDMYIFSPNDDVEQVYQAVNDIYLIQGSVDGNGDAHEGQQFGSGRYTFAFKTGDYTGMQADQFDISYYMQLIGLGKVPTDVKLKNVHVPPVLPAWNVTCNFWMDIENLEIAEESVYGSTDTWYNFMWSVSQAAPARRLSVKRPASLNFMWDGWSSGGYIADSVFAQPVGSWTQQQYYIRNSELNNNFYGVNWNMVAQGTKGITVTDQNHPLYALESGVGQTNWRSGGKYTLIDSTDVIREKPFLYFDESVKEYKVFVPALRENAKGVSWFRTNMGQGTSLNISDFYIARADKDNGASINQALKEGKHILLSPGIYYAEEPIHVEKANTVILGLGLATIIPTNNETAIKIDDVGGVTVAGVILDADSYSKNMLVVGEEGCNKNHASNPTVLQDLFVRIGGVHGGVASTDQAVVINSNDVIGDDFWIWRADHGQGVGWNLNKAKNGVVVNGANVTMYGLMVEHFQEYDVLWRGENGKTYFLQNEKCYDPQNQADWMSHEGTVKGFAAYKVANCVKNHYAVGLGSYDVFINTNGASIFMDNAIEVPDTAGVRIENACTVEIANADGPYVGFNHIVNGTGAAITNGVGGQGYARQALLSYNNKKALVLEDYYQAGGNDSGVVLEEMGVTPTDDPAAEKNITKEEPSDDPEKPIEEEAPDVYAGLGLNFAEGSVAEGAYADWKNNAITYPSKGGLVAAGYIDAAFGKLAGAIQYEVYVDGRLIETISGTDAQAAEYQVEFYSVEVAKHTIYVVATLENNDKVTSNVRAFYVSKKGMGIWQDDADKIEELNLSWYYTWSPYELNGVDKDVDFVPMVWGDEADTRSVDRVNEWKWLRAGNWRNYRYLLTFNEPDFTDQSHMTPERAVELWREIEPICDEPSIDVSSPVVAIPTVFYPDTNNDYNTVGGWYGKYDQLMATAEYHDEFTAVHFYFDYPGEWILDTLEQIHETTNKPLWITEWGVGQWSQVQDFDWTGGPDEGNWQRSLIVDFMKDVIPQIDQLPYVERYAWFPFDGSNTDKYGNGAGGLFYCGSNDPLKGQLTAAGKAYKQVGNPAGWEAGAITEDKVVVDQLSGGEEEEKPPVLEGERRNVVKGKNITASTELGGNVAANAVDGNEGSRWESVHNQEDAEWLAVDLGGTYIIDSFKVIWENAAAKEYQIQVSNDGENWTDVYTVTDGRNAETRTGSFDAVSARFVRLYGTVKTMAIYGYSLYEWEVYGVEQEQDTPPTEQPGEEEAELPVITEHSNVAAGKVISASTELGGNVAANAIDGNTASRWESVQGKEDAEWIEINLGGMYAIDSFKAVWENAAAKEYQIQVSTDGSSWKSVYTVTDGKSGETRSESFDAVLASYIRLYGTVKTMPVYGYSLYELEIYGEKQNTGAEHSNPGEDTQPGEDTSTKEHFNVAAGKTITASTELGGNVAANAVDGNPTSRWESVQGKEDAEWLLIDLGDTYTVDSFKLTWENASAAKYTIEVSADGNEWKTVYAVNNGVSGETREDSFAAASARYVRLNGTSKTMAIYGYSLYEFEVYAVK